MGSVTYADFLSSQLCHTVWKSEEIMGTSTFLEISMKQKYIHWESLHKIDGILCAQLSTWMYLDHYDNGSN